MWRSIVVSFGFVRRLVLLAWLWCGCSGPGGTCGSGAPLRRCPELPTQLAIGEVVGVIVGYERGARASVVASVTASVAVHGGRFKVGQFFELADAFSARVDRGGAEVLCGHGLVTDVEEVGFACPTD